MALQTPEWYIQEWGGKIGGHCFLLDKGGFESYLPNALFLHPDEELDIKAMNEKCEEFLGRFRFITTYIVRGSHPNDHEGLVDVIESFGNTRFRDIGKKISEIREHANSPDVYVYSEWEGQPYDGKIRIMVAEQLQHSTCPDFSAERGSVIEHPHERGTYVLEVVSPALGDSFDIDRVVVKNGNIVHGISDGIVVSRDELTSHILKRDHYHQIIQLYELVKASGFVPPDTSFQMEYGFTLRPHPGKKNVQFFQARLFKKFQEPNFHLGQENDISRLCYGMTGEDGLVLPVITYDGHNDAKITNYPSPFALMLKPVEKEFHKRSINLNLRPKNMVAFIASGTRAASLEHLNYRWVNKAQVSVQEKGLAHIAATSKKVRIISNGLHAQVERVS